MNDRGGKIIRVETPIVDLPFKRMHRLSRADLLAQSYTLCRIHTEDGIIGTGDAVVPGGPWWGGEAAESIKAMLDTYIVPLLMGRSVFDLNAITADIEQRVFGNPCAKSAVEVALLDAISRTLGISLSAYLGGAVRQSIPCLWALATGKLEADVAEAQALVEAERHAMFKIKLGFGSPLDDIKRVAETSRQIGLPCSIDLNEAWSVADAAFLMPHLADSGVVMIEQPIMRTDLRGLARLTSSSAIPIMADEAVCAVHEAQAVIETRAAHAISLKISKSGGIRKTRLIAEMARSGGLGVFGGTALDGSIGVAASLQLFSTLPALQWGCELFGPLLLAEDIVTEPIRYDARQVWLPPGPGTGVTVDEDRLRHFAREGTYNQS